MKVSEFVKLWSDGSHNDIDVYDNVCEEIAIAYCGGYTLTEEGTEHFKDALEMEIDVIERDCIAIVDVDDEEGIWQKKLKKAKEFFYSIAGYCSDNNFDKWFVEA